MSVPKSRKAVLLRTLREMGCDEQRMKVVAQLVEQVVWLEESLDRARTDIGDEGVVVPYNNGGGQSGTRKNPAYDAILKLNSTYNASLRALVDACVATSDEKTHGAIKATSAARRRDVMEALRSAETGRQS